LKGCKENKQLLEYMQEGMKENIETIKKNIEHITKYKENK
jgi:hypothetical protein